MWNEQKSAQLVKTYKTNGYDAAQAAKALGVSERSAISKLVALGEYVKPVSTKPSTGRINKAQYISAVEAMLGVKSGKLAGLSGASANAIEELAAALVKLGDRA